MATKEKPSNYKNHAQTPEYRNVWEKMSQQFSDTLWDCLIHPNGSAEFSLWEWMGAVTVNNPNCLPWMLKAIQALREQKEEDKKFHEKLISLGVKAYRVNDGWVDRKNNVVTFFKSEKSVWYYRWNLDLELGDKIFLGDQDCGGRFAVITEIGNYGFSSRKYGFEWTDETLDGKDLDGNIRPYFDHISKKRQRIIQKDSSNERVSHEENS